MEALPLQRVIQSPKGEKILDFGQNFAGFVRMSIRAPKGTVVTLEHSEVLDKNASFIQNIMGVNKDQTDIFVCCGEGEEIFEPRFTFHGFRYVRVTGVPDWNQVRFAGIPITSKMEDAGSFSCSDKRLNQLYSNVRWSQYANMLSIPTDCPQRERAGWTGDIAVFGATAVRNQNMQTFLIRWLENMEAEQMADGRIPNVIPYSLSYQNQMQSVFKDECSAGWSDACIILPYLLYTQYGDVSSLRRFYPMMKKWIAFVQNQAETETPKSFQKKKNKTAREAENQKYLWNTHWHFGDWLIPSQSKSMLDAKKSGQVTKEVVAPMYYAYGCLLMSRIAEILGEQADAERYRTLHQRIRKAFAETYVDRQGRVKPDLQGIYVLALWLDLIPETLKKQSAEHLVQLIHANGDCLDTGFLATPVLLDVLCGIGQKELAYTLLYQENAPSWLYEVKMGATTIWENWRAIRPDGKPTTFSYNHYANGCVFDWIYRTVGGIQMAAPAYKSIRVCPQPDERLSWAQSSYESVYGTVFCQWERRDGIFNMTVQIPCNCSASVCMPNGEVHQVGSGSYRFQCQIGKE